MKATFINKQGDPNVLTYGDLPDPVRSQQQVLIRVKATALNHLDIFTRSGRNGVVVSRFPHVLGCDIAGEVEEVDSEAKGISTGDRIVVDYSIRCGKCINCYAGRDQFCENSNSVGVSVDGGYAQYVTVPFENVHLIPDSLPFVEAAAIPLVYKTVWHCLITRCDLQPGEDVLVMAAGSGVGSAAICLAKLMGARVIATASTDEKLAKAKDLGADEVINYLQMPKYSGMVQDITEGKGVDLIFDSVGASVWDENVRSLKAGGRLVNCGVTSGHRASLRIGQMFSKGLTFMGASNGNKSDFSNIMKLVRRGHIKGIVSDIFPLENAFEAHKAMESRNVFGKLVLEIP